MDDDQDPFQRPDSWMDHCARTMTNVTHLLLEYAVEISSCREPDVTQSMPRKKWLHETPSTANQDQRYHRQEDQHCDSD
jgi:hypothetical protein